MSSEKSGYAAIPKLWEIQESDVEVSDDILGVGGFGQVVRGLWLKQVPVAVKETAFTENYSESDFDNESEIWYSLSHPRILPLYGLIRKGVVWRFVSPIIENGDTKTFLAKIPHGPERHMKTLVLLRDIAEGMAFLHSKDVIHADLKPAQVLVDKKLRGVITDFGVSKLARSLHNDSENTQSNTPFANSSNANTTTGSRSGTPAYMSPERLMGQGTTKKDDVYAFGIAIFVVWTSQSPYPQLSDLDDAGREALLLDICSGKLRPILPPGSHMPRPLEVLMQRCWSQEPEVRPDFDTILSEIKELVPHVPLTDPTPAPTPFVTPEVDVNQLLALARQAASNHDMDTASQMFARVAEMGSPEAQERIAFFYRNGLGHLERDLVEALNWYTKAAENDYPQAQVVLGEFYYFGFDDVVRKDPAEAVKWWKRAAQQNYADGQNKLGVCFYNGAGVDQDLDQAVAWFQKAADQGLAKAQYNLGACYANGWGVAKDEDKVVEWYGKAAAQGDALVQDKLGLCYQYGWGVSVDLELAATWFRKAAEQGHAGGQCHLGWCYQSGEGVTLNLEKAAQWFQKSAEQGYSEGQCNLGICYGNGWGVAKDLVKAEALLRKAIKQGNTRAKQVLAVLKES